MSFATVIKKLLLILFLPPEQELLNVIDAEPHVQEMRGRLVHVPRCVICAYPCLRVRGQPGPTSRGLDTGRVFKVPYRFCPESEAVVKERALSGGGGGLCSLSAQTTTCCAAHTCPMSFPWPWRFLSRCPIGRLLIAHSKKPFGSILN